MQSEPEPDSAERDRDLGFGAVVADATHQRLLNRDGSFNVRRTGLAWRHVVSLYYSLLSLTWPRFILLTSAAYLGINAEIPRASVVANGHYVGPGYGQPTAEMAEAVNLMAREEGILLDPVYSGKGMAGLIGEIRKGTFTKKDSIVFLHTGGSASLFAYEALFSEKAA